MRKKTALIIMAAILLTAGNTSYAAAVTQQENEVQAVDGAQLADEVQAVDEAQAADEVQKADGTQSANEVQKADGTQAADEVQTADGTQAADEVQTADGTQAADETPTDDETLTDDVDQMAMAEVTQDEALAWVKAQVGKSIDADKVYGAQCVDLILAYYDFLGVPRSLGNGADYVSNPLPTGWSRIKGAVPRAGDILVYTGGPGGYGHVGIFESAYSTYHQNVKQKYVERITWAYDTGFSTTPYWGVIRPNFSLDGKPVQPKFTDVSGADWFYNEVNYVFEQGLMTGLTANTFGPYQSLSRAQFATILYRMEGSPKTTYRNQFSDVSQGEWYSNPIIWANDAKIVSGYANSSLFGTGDSITREQMTVMMFRYAQYKGYDTSQRADFGKYKDASSVSGFARESMEWAVSKGIISGKDNGTMIVPQGDALRAECAVIIKRFMENHK